MKQHCSCDDGPIGNSEDESDKEEPKEGPEKVKKGHFIFPPSIEQAKKVYTDLTNILKPQQKKGSGYLVGISMGNPGICRANPYPYPLPKVGVSRVRIWFFFAGSQVIFGQ